MSSRAKPKKTERMCNTCGVFSLYWNMSGTVAICNSCSRVKSRAVGEYMRDLERKKLLMRECQGCGATERLCVHHLHGKSPATAHGILCARCNIVLGQFGDDPWKMKWAMRGLLEMDGVHFGLNHWDPERDGLYVAPHKWRCDVCDKILTKAGRGYHEKSKRHLEALVSYGME